LIHESYYALSPARRRRLRSRGVPLLVALAAASLGAGMLVGGLPDSATEDTARRFASAWQRGDFVAMHRLISPDDRQRASLPAFRAAYERAAATATATGMRTGEVRVDGELARIPVVVTTRVFGSVRGDVIVRVSAERVEWDRSLVFPGLRGAERLTRETIAPPRAAIEARDGTEIVSGPATARVPGGSVGSSIAGTVSAPETPAEKEDLRRRGFPPDTPVGRSGLERIADSQVAGKPGGRLLAGGRVLAGSEPREAAPVKTTIDLDIQEAAVTALAGRFGGIAALDAQTGEVRALAGIAFSAPQPPGSTFKIITAVAGLEAGVVKPSDRFPIQTKAVVDGVDLQNANGESCGGTFVDSFAHSCNSVFAPLGVKIGAKRLVATAERFGFNRPPGIPGAAESTIPAAEEINGDLDLGSSAIGQGRVQATPLALASVAQTIAAGGVRRIPTVLAGAPSPEPVRVTTAKVARQVEKMMIEVVERGTGQLASLDGAKVAGKTGTAELKSTVKPEGAPPSETEEPPGSDTDAWFAAYTPIKKPKIAVGVLFVKNGAGGATAAPAARIVLAAALR
jgi:cell division protein FtsI/penicillin-binding protein 2